jgi:two-component system sensor histidine kinase/response regulator
VLIHLLSNAVKFTPKGQVSLSAALAHETPSDVIVRIEVRDTGPGIAADVQHELFQPFKQADGSSTRRHGGLGLGLALCRQLVELMGGHIGVISESDKGSVFWITLPLRRHRASAPGVSH